MLLLRTYSLLASSLHYSSEHTLHQVHPISTFPVLGALTLPLLPSDSSFSLANHFSSSYFPFYLVPAPALGLDFDLSYGPKYLLKVERPYTRKDLVQALALDSDRVGADEQEERVAYKVNKAIVDIDHNSLDSDLGYLRNIPTKTHQIHNQDEEEDSVVPDYHHYYYCFPA
jgi:hypothetical protein